MAIVCPSCGQQNPEGFRVCGMLEIALDFHRSVGATFYLKRGEQLIAKTA